MIKVYSDKTCAYCVALENYLNKNKIEFERKDVTRSKECLEEMESKSGQGGVPVIQIGNEIIIGFNKKRLREILNIW